MSHIHELIDYTVALFIQHDNKILLIHHKKLNRWLPIGGHIELDENPEEGLFRELKEETGLTKNDVDLLTTKPKLPKTRNTKFLYTPNFLDIHNISDTHSHIGFIYFLKSKTIKLKHAVDEHNAIRWVDKADIDSKEYDLSPEIKFYIKELFETKLT